VVKARAPRMADHDDVNAYTAAWLVAFRQVVDAAGKADETYIVPDAVQAREIDALIVALKGHLRADAPVLA
jgi:hypothetical protein